MSKHKSLLLTFLLTFLLSMTIVAQDDEWQTLIFADSAILRVTADELVDTIELPQEAQSFHSGNTAFFVALSSDERYFAFVTEDNSGSGFTSTLNIADLQEGTCCQVIPAPDGQDWEVTNLGIFSPDGRHLVINFLNSYFATPDSLLAILDIETGDYVTTLNPYDAFDTNALFFVGWNEDGIEVVPTCFPCGASADGHTKLWNPDTGEITDNYSFNASLMGSRLANGEIIQGAQNDEYPIGEADVMIGPFNVIEYFTADNIEDSEIIYFNPDNLNLLDIEWVIDGQAYLIQDQFAEGATLVWRNGEFKDIEFDNQQLFFTGTPDGWLMTDPGMQQLFQYQWIDGELLFNELGTYPLLKLLQSPILGDSGMDEITPIISPEV